MDSVGGRSCHTITLPPSSCALQTRRLQKSFSHPAATALDVAAKGQPSWLQYLQRLQTLSHAAALRSQKLDPESVNSNVSDIAVFIWTLVDDYECRVGAFIPLIPHLLAEYAHSRIAHTLFLLYDFRP